MATRVAALRPVLRTMDRALGRTRSRRVKRLARTVLFGPGEYLDGLRFDRRCHGVYEIDGLRFSIPGDLTDRRFRSRFQRGTYETEELDLIAALMPADLRLLDLGGCLGVVSCVSNRHLTDPDAHLVVEANPTLIPHLEHNRARNGARFKIRHGAVTTASSVTFFENALIVGGSTYRETDRPRPVPALRLEDLERETGVQFNGLLMDIEGGELAFLREHPAFLERLVWVCVQVHDFIMGDAAADECRERLSAAGLRCVVRRGTVDVWARP